MPAAGRAPGKMNMSNKYDSYSNRNSVLFENCIVCVIRQKV